MSQTITLPPRTLLVLCGPAGSGKSTFVTQRFTPTAIVSSDYCRALVCDDETNQQVNRDAFDLFHFIIHKRLFNGRFTIADSTALLSSSRLRLIDIARKHGYLACLLIFNTSVATCLQRDQQRTRQVGTTIINYHVEQLQQTLLAAPNEGWDQFYIVEETEQDTTVLEIREGEMLQNAE